MSDQLTDRVSFDFIRYANCWEDADLLLRALKVGRGDKVLSIASAGDNSFALLAHEPELVVAVDVNSVQLYLCELKKAAFTLDYDSFLGILGFAPCNNRLEMYTKLRSQLPAEARNYWDHHTEQIEDGIINAGKFERYFGVFRKKILPWIHSRDTIAELFREKPAKEQETFYDESWNTWRWRTLFRIFFSRHVMGKYGRDPEFMNEVDVVVSKYIFMQAEAELRHTKVQQNLYLKYLLTGEFSQLPYYARKENFERIKNNINAINFMRGYAEDAIRNCDTFTAFNLSNIFEYLTVHKTKEIVRTLVNGASEGARFAYWNLMVPRVLSSLFPDKIIADSSFDEQFKQQDKGFFYRKFNIEIIQ